MEGYSGLERRSCSIVLFVLFHNSGDTGFLVANLKISLIWGLEVSKKVLKVLVAQGTSKLQHLKFFALPLYKGKCHKKIEVLQL